MNDEQTQQPPPAAGDVVRLRSGGPQMTVKAVKVVARVEVASCAWFPSGTYGAPPVEAEFPLCCLERARQ